MKRNNNSVFITIEGIDGSGKSTQTSLLCEWLAGLLGTEGVLRTFEPGDWEGGSLLRSLLLDGIDLEPRTELLLFLADRSGHVHTKIIPALNEGRWVVCERYTDSTLAYQAWGRGIADDEIQLLMDWCHFPVPDLTVLLDIDLETAGSRLISRGQRDRIESLKGSFMERVAQGYRELAARHPERYVVVNAALDVLLVAELVREEIQKKFGKRLENIPYKPILALEREHFCEGQTGN